MSFGGFVEGSLSSSVDAGKKHARFTVYSGSSFLRAPAGSYYVGRGRESQWLLTGLGGIRVQFFGVRLNHFVRKEPWR